LKIGSLPLGGKSRPAFCPPSGNRLSSSLGFHSRPKAMPATFFFTGLVRSFHNYCLVVFENF